MPRAMKAAIFTVFLLCSPSIRAAESPGESILRKLDQIVIPIIDFKDTSIEEAIDYLRVRSIELDKNTPHEDRGISIIVRKPRAKDNSEKQLKFHGDARGRRIEGFQAIDISLTKALIEVGTRTDTDIYVTTDGVVICPQGVEPFPNPKSQNGKILKKLTPSQKASER